MTPKSKSEAKRLAILKEHPHPIPERPPRFDEWLEIARNSEFSSEGTNRIVRLMGEYALFLESRLREHEAAWERLTDGQAVLAAQCEVSYERDTDEFRAALAAARDTARRGKP